MNDKKLVFRTEVISALFGTYRAGDIAIGIDPAIADELVATGAAVYADGDGKAQADAAAEAAGRITDATQLRPISKQEHKFSVGNVQQQIDAGVVSPAPLNEESKPVEVTSDAFKTAPVGGVVPNA